MKAVLISPTPPSSTRMVEQAHTLLQQTGWPSWKKWTGLHLSGVYPAGPPPAGPPPAGPPPAGSTPVAVRSGVPHTTPVCLHLTTRRLQRTGSTLQCRPLAHTGSTFTTKSQWVGEAMKALPLQVTIAMDISRVTKSTPSLKPILLGCAQAPPPTAMCHPTLHVRPWTTVITPSPLTHPPLQQRTRSTLPLIAAWTRCSAVC